MVMPGLVDIHSHPSSEPGNKGMTDEVGTPKLYNSSLYEFLWLFRADAEGIPHLNHVAWSELLMSGTTTLVDLSFPSEGWLDRAAASGLRMVMAPMYRNGRWFTRNGYQVEYELDDAAGRKAMEDAFKVIDAALAHESGRLSGLACPAQIDTCTEELFRASIDLGIPVQRIREALAGFGGVKRRFTKTGEWNGALIFDDYGHHPVEIAAVLKAARASTKNKVIDLGACPGFHAQRSPRCHQGGA